MAELASVTGRTIRNYLKNGRLIGRKIGGQWRFPENEVQRLLNGGPADEFSGEGDGLDMDEPLEVSSASAFDASDAAPSAEQYAPPAAPPVPDTLSFDTSGESAPLPAAEPPSESGTNDASAYSATVEPLPEPPAQTIDNSTFLHYSATPAPLPTPAPPPVSAPVQAQAPAAVPMSAPVQAQAPVAVPMSAPVQAQAPAAVPTSAPVQAQAPAAVPTSAPVQAQAPAAVPTSAPVQAQAPVAVPTSAPVQAQAPASTVVPQMAQSAVYCTPQPTMPSDFSLSPLPISTPEQSGGVPFSQIQFTPYPQNSAQAPPQNSQAVPTYAPLAPTQAQHSTPYLIKDENHVYSYVIPAGVLPGTPLPAHGRPYIPAMHPEPGAMYPPYVYFSQMPQHTPSEPENIAKPPAPDVTSAPSAEKSGTDVTTETTENTLKSPNFNENFDDSSNIPELSDVGKEVVNFISEVHDCSHGPQLCTMVELHQSVSAARLTNDKLVQIASEESEPGQLCRSLVEFDDRFFVARYTLFGSTTFILRCLNLIG